MAGRTPLPWSYTSLDDFANCPRAYFEKKIAKSVVEEKTEALVWGDRVHKAFEARQRDGTPLPEEMIEHEPYMKKLAEMPGNHWTEQRIALNIAAQPCEFFDKDVWFRGLIDYYKIHDSKGLIVDYKTGKPHSKFDQLRLCAIYLFTLHPDVHSIDVRFYWTQTQTTTGATYTRDSKDELWTKFIPTLKQYAQAFKDDIWQPRPSGLCNGWCPVKSCEFWKPRKN